MKKYIYVFSECTINESFSHQYFELNEKKNKFKLYYF